MSEEGGERRSWWSGGFANGAVRRKSESGLIRWGQGGREENEI